MNEVISTLLVWVGVALFIGGCAYFYFVKIEHLTEEDALRRAVKIAFEIWQVSSFTAPRELLKPQVAGPLLREAGLVLKAEVVGNSTHGYAMAESAAKPHPELVRVDPIELALGVQRAVLGGAQ